MHAAWPLIWCFMPVAQLTSDVSSDRLLEVKIMTDPFKLSTPNSSNFLIDCANLAVEMPQRGGLRRSPLVIRPAPHIKSFCVWPQCSPCRRPSAHLVCFCAVTHAIRPGARAARRSNCIRAAAPSIRLTAQTVGNRPSIQISGVQLGHSVIHTSGQHRRCWAGSFRRSRLSATKPLRK